MCNVTLTDGCSVMSTSLNVRPKNVLIAGARWPTASPEYISFRCHTLAPDRHRQIILDFRTTLCQTASQKICRAQQASPQRRRMHRTWRSRKSISRLWNSRQMPPAMQLCPTCRRRTVNWLRQVRNLKRLLLRRKEDGRRCRRTIPCIQANLRETNSNEPPC